MKILTVLGARPQFIKAAAVSRALVYSANHSRLAQVLIHTGQHFDASMSQVFFDELGIPRPDYNLGIGGGSHGQNTGRMIEAIEAVLVAERPDWVLVYGDTDSTLAGTLAATKLHIPVAHVEAGLRSHNRRMPEEINRVLTDHAAALLFAPTRAAIKNLRKEGFGNIVKDEKSLSHCQQPGGKVQLPIVVNVGDVMYDATLFFGAKAERHSQIIQNLGLTPKDYVLATMHRAENTDDLDRMSTILDALRKISNQIKVVLPLHPRTRKRLEIHGLSLKHQSLFPESRRSSRLICIDPLGYLDMLMLEKKAAVIVTDSGGVQKEAYFHSVPCVTMREETEWVELVEMGWNRLAPPDTADIATIALGAIGTKGKRALPYGKGNAAEKIREILEFFGPSGKSVGNHHGPR